jgi:hypothetical protein
MFLANDAVQHTVFAILTNLEGTSLGVVQSACRKRDRRLREIVDPTGAEGCCRQGSLEIEHLASLGMLPKISENIPSGIHAHQEL